MPFLQELDARVLLSFMIILLWTDTEMLALGFCIPSSLAPSLTCLGFQYEGESRPQVEQGGNKRRLGFAGSAIHAVTI